MNLPFQQDEEANILPDKAKTALKNYPRLQPEASFNRAIIQSLDLEKMRRRATLVGRIEEFLGIGIWQFASTSALGAFVPCIILGSMLFSSQKSAPEDYQPKPLPDPLNLNYYGPLYARELLENHAKAAKTSLVMPLRNGEICLDSKFLMA